jgi:hypothetical protein
MSMPNYGNGELKRINDSCDKFSVSVWRSCAGFLFSSRTEMVVIATLPPFGPIEGHKWFFQISSQWESRKSRFAFISFGKIQFYLPAFEISRSCRTASDLPLWEVFAERDKKQTMVELRWISTDWFWKKVWPSIRLSRPRALNTPSKAWMPSLL